MNIREIREVLLKNRDVKRNGDSTGGNTVSIH